MMGPFVLFLTLILHFCFYAPYITACEKLEKLTGAPNDFDWGKCGMGKGHGHKWGRRNGVQQAEPVQQVTPV